MRYRRLDEYNIYKAEKLYRISDRKTQLEFPYKIPEHTEILIKTPPLSHTVKTKNKSKDDIILICMCVLCGAIIFNILPDPWNWMGFGLGGPIFSLISRIIKK